MGSNDATVVERIGTASGAPTVLESKMGPAGAEPTVLERQIAKPKKNSMMIGAIAAVVVIALAIGGYFIKQSGKGTGTVTTGSVTGSVSTVATSGTTVTAVIPPPPGQQGRLLLSASPWGELEKIVNVKTNEQINLDEEKRSTPTAILLDPGKYSVTVRGPQNSQTIDVDIAAGPNLRKKIVTAAVNYDDLEKEMNKQ